MISNVNKLIIWILLFSCCWGILPYQFVLLPVVFALYYMIKTILERRPGMFKKYLIIYFIFFIISAFSCMHFEDQSLSKTFTAVVACNFSRSYLISYFYPANTQ